MFTVLGYFTDGFLTDTGQCVFETVQASGEAATIVNTTVQQ
jgi:hypothetical protein